MLSHPYAFVTPRFTSYVPAVLYVMPVGFAWVDEEGVPPENVQFQLVGVFDELSLKLTVCPWLMVVLVVAIKLAAGFTPV